METRRSQSKSSDCTTWSSGSSSDQELWPGTFKTKSRPLSLFKSQDSSSSDSDQGDCIETRCYSSQPTKSATSIRPQTSKKIPAVPPLDMGLLGRYSNVVIGIAIFDVVLSLVALICWGIAVLLMVMIVLQKRSDRAAGDTTSTSDAGSFGASRIFLYSFHPMFYLLSLLAAILMAARIEKMTECRDLQPQLVKRACVWWILASFWHGLEMEFVIFTLAKQSASMILPITYLIIHLVFKVLATTLVGLLLDTDSISDCRRLIFETFYIS